ncbi:transient receptor potential cation channel subfamily A member 1-like isoform X1 [Xenia sp. Carnegie-2017]|uniref:transient receptor potential cation channel subfamily A member 1-like isoform X1 n=1 Tax=Xenia sp. Carnegie-2017 TaxID=2897299 RepID=UPI001F0396EC|nr:transient receptor potential cation channel subfamily A member 1-like isoform X1 [Xenia sp. Carnegie-2017]XP_046848682.1 transient receptor potential cation channel subfamily A member 1-like isoform X1 [Xenia sp. Carnegie-2017]XP_046848684.1 transient receptor potential cation channel subfamily A member 1-like isoform X1 [Xenia sp. Carnegie-2017]
MANYVRSRWYVGFPRPKRSVDYDLSSEVNRAALARLKPIDEQDTTDLQRAGTVPDVSDVDENGSKVQTSLADEMKLAAIYDDQTMINNILREKRSNREIQRLLSRTDERGQPCIFYALESRSLNSLTSLLNHVKDTKCVIAKNGESVLHVATRMGDVDFLHNLLQHDFIVDLVNHVESVNGRSPLHFAATFNHVEIAKVLLEHGGKITEVDITERCPLYIAANKGHANMLELFLKHEKSRVQELLFSEEYGGSHYRNILHVAVDSGDERTVQVCLQDEDVIREDLREEIRHGDGYLIHAACKNGMEKSLFRFVDVMTHLDLLQLNRKDKQGFTPIHKAAINNHSDIVSYIGSKSKIFVNEKTENSQSALVLAAQRGHVRVVEELLKLKADFTIRDDSNRTVLHYAIAHPETLRILLKKKDLGPLLINEKEIDGYTPIHNAALKGLLESVRILLEYNADLNVFTNTSRSPLHCAVSSQNSDVVELILANEPALINKVDATGKTPLHTAANYSSPEVVKCLLNKGAIIVRDGNLFSPLHIAAFKGHLNIVELLVMFKPSMIDWENKYKRTALLTAAVKGKADVVKYLLDSMVAITEDYEFFNCLDWAIINDDTKSAMVMMCHDRWKEIILKTKNGTEGTMAKLVSKNMSEVAYRALSNSMKTTGHPESIDHLVAYDFLCLQNTVTNKRGKKLKPFTAIKAMLRNSSYQCLCHPVCCKYLKAKWMEFGWKVCTTSFMFYFLFLVSLNVYAFGIPSYKASVGKDELPNASINVKVAMLICLISAGVQTLKEIGQLFVYKFNYLMDKVNYLECVLYVSTFIFAVPSNDSMSVKTSFQWMACSVALFCAWMNLIMYLRRFASYGIIILMMRKISFTLIKVMGLLIFFLVAFAAAFTVIMNDRQGFDRFSVSILTGATMTMGEFDFKQTFLGDHSDYNTFYPLQLVLLAGFLVVMPIIIMNLLLALAIDDTSSIMQHAKLQKHIQTVRIFMKLSN